MTLAKGGDKLCLKASFLGTFQLHLHPQFSYVLAKYVI